MPARISLTAVLVLVIASFAIPATAGAADWPIVGWWPLNEGRG
jgi:hypothetical protein